MTRNPVSPRFIFALRALAVMIVTLMALGAGVRAMNAGLACPDWPLCFGKVIPDFHPAVWFEFVHRAYAGLVSLTFFGCLVYAFASKTVSSRIRMIGVFGLVCLLAQILFGALTVRLQVRSGIVTTHLMLATFFFLSVLWMSFEAKASIVRPEAVPPRWLGALSLLPILVLGQIFLGGWVASTFAGSVCVDWPLCNGQWVPTWSGAIGLQIIHRFVAYSLALAFAVLAFAMWRLREAAWMTKQLLRLTNWAAVIVLVQVGVGIANLLFFIPPSLTVLHQSVAIVLLAVCTRLAFVAMSLLSEPSANRAAHPDSRARSLPSSKQSFSAG
ncbi:MAG: COX15/CtaA family protein [Bdellovibrionota bacterium]